MSTLITCSCGARWDWEATAGVCPACGAFAPEMPTRRIQSAPGQPLGTVAEATEPGPPVPAGQAVSAPEGFEVLEVLGRGGMGVVYKARDTRLDRLVAIKTLLAGAHAGPELLTRFVNEAVTVARLEHPNIVQLHAVSDAGGQPCLVMEYLPGGSLAQRLRGRPQPAAHCAEMVEALARAVHSAHQAGVVHRDLKPANVLLAADGTPKVADFGLAKQLDRDGGPTHSGAILGTPAYMAPEQAGGMTRQVTPLIDVYALGAILYEMLTGRPPFLADEPVQTVLLVLGTEPVAPRRLQPGVPRDLETICLKCLEKSAARRYASAADLADDLRRFREGLPIAARPAGPLVRLAKWVRRRPGPAALAGVSALALVAVLAVGAWYQVHLADALRNEKSARSRADDLNVMLTRSITEEQKQRARAVDNLELAGERLDQFAEALEAEFSALPRTSRVRRDVWDAVLALQQPVLERDPTNPYLRRLRVQQEWHRGVALESPAERERACQSLRQALADLDDLPAAGDERARKQLRARVLNTLGLVLSVDDPDAAEKTYRQAQQSLAGLTEGDGASPEYVRDLAMIDNNLGLLLSRREPRDEGRELLREAVRLREGLVRHHGDDPRHRLELAQSRINLGSLERAAGRRADAAKEFAAAVAAFAELPSSLSGRADCRRNRAMAESNLAASLESPAEVEAAYRRATEQFDALAESFPFEPEFRVNAAYTRKQLAHRLLQRAQGREAEDLLREAVRLAERLSLDEPDSISFRKEWLEALDALSSVLSEQNRTKEVAPLWRAAEDAAREVARRRTDAHGPRLLAAVLQEAALQRLKAGDAADAVRLATEAVLRRQEAQQRQPPDPGDRTRLVSHYLVLAEAQTGQGNYAEAMAAVEKAMAQSAEPLPGVVAGWGEVRAALVLTKVVVAAGADSQLEEKRRRETVEQAGARAVALLRSAWQKGSPEAPTFGDRPALSPLRGRADFHELMREIEKAKPSPR
jgi:serine/threonine-protein kinase